MKKIVYVTNRLRPGAIPNILLSILPIINREFDVYILSLQKIDNENLKQKLEVLSTDISSLEIGRISFFETIKKMKTYFEEVKPDVVHSHLGRADLFSAICKPEKSLLVSTFHSMKDNYNYLSRIGYKLTDNQVDMRTAVSEAVKNSWYDNDFLNSHCRTVYNPTNVRYSSELEEQVNLKIELGISEEKFIITNIGNIRKQKSQINLIKAFSLFKKQHPESILLLIGRKDNAYKEILQEIETHELLESVKLLGYREDVNELLAISDLFVFPSQTEGLGLAIIEAMAQKVPVIASNIEALSEYIENRKNGLLFEVGNHVELFNLMNELYHNKILLDELKENGYLTVKQNFESEKIAKQYLDLYFELLKN